MFKKLSRILELYILELEKRLELAVKALDESEIIKQWDLETGRKFNNIINKYAIDEEKLLSISETVAKFVTITGKTNIDKYLFEDDELTIPRIIK